jgi:hypothetical protein
MNSSRSKAAIDNFLTSALKDIIGPEKISDALTRLGQSGRLTPALYKVVQPKPFGDLFHGLGVSASHVDDAIRRPDDYQHLMTEGMPEGSENAKAVSLFMKRVISRDRRNSHWLLVQTLRSGIDQIVQSARKIYPDDVDLSAATQPIDVLKAFVESFGSPISVGETKALFVDARRFPYDAQVKVDWTGAPVEHFVSFSKLEDAATSLFKVGIAFCINIPKYRVALKAHGVAVVAPAQIFAPLQMLTTT